MMDTATAARAVAGNVHGANVRFLRVTTDTRGLVPGDLFVALKGEHFDGHDFVAAAQARGASAALVAADRAFEFQGNLIAAPDPLAALGALAAHWRTQFAIPVIVIAGSNGKTTVKEMLRRRPAPSLRCRCRARDGGQFQQRDRLAADAPVAPRSAPRRRDRARDEPSRRDGSARGDRADRPSRSSTTRSASTRNSW